MGESVRPLGIEVEAAGERWISEWAEALQRFDEFDRRVRPPDAATRALLDATPDEDLTAVFLASPST